MTKTPQEAIIAALIAKLGGEVHISVKEYQEAEDLELYRCDTLDFNSAMSFKVRKPPVILQGELMGDQQELDG